MIRTEAALLCGPGEQLVVSRVDLDDPEPNEVLVAVTNVGLCRSDLHYLDGSLATAVPAVLGHEVAGVVERVGAQVSNVRPGDRVVASLIPSCGFCTYCESGRSSLCARTDEVRRRPRPALRTTTGDAVTRLADIGGFARHVLLRDNAAIRLPDAVPSRVGCLLSCCVATGVGSVFHAAGVRPGSSVAVVGCGGVGSAIIQGSMLAGAREIVAIDLSACRLNAAHALGATATVDASLADLGAAVRAIVPGGVEYSFDAVGSARTGAVAVNVLRPGGTATIVGISPPGTELTISAEDFWAREKRVIGAYMGASRMHADVAEYGRLYERGALRLDDMVSAEVALSDINDGFDLLRGANITRVVVDTMA